MKEPISFGDLVISIAGRDKGEKLLVINVSDGYATVVNGKTRKVENPKRKKIKHLEKIFGERVDLAQNIQNGKPVGNKRLYRAVNAEKEKV
ncbi:MAG: KOW domain-containing RNA-binding protein [Clostridia bacterium]|nr:KOW domain-containing RNA-binding protein [Clostridia bacterium]